MRTSVNASQDASTRDRVICVLLIGMVIVMGAMTMVRLGYLPGSTLQPFLTVEPAAAQTWNARVGRLHSCGTNCFFCDSGYGLATNYHDVRNTNNAIWWTCVAGPW